MNTPTNYIGDLTADTTYESERFLLRLVRESDAEDLLECYSDPAAQKLFYSDNCTSDFVYANADELREYIRSWLEAFESKGFYRFAIVDKTNGKAIGTIEMFGRPESQDNILRLD
ncbi:MAG: GNAT family N-acetyltransferase [Oscillospiraceae bacterium]|jgi:RimJ/RimL family protein N-acetyltransferase|nr:GNAT family N-acetyltransferase [Oscillospiraceae bacterium]